MFQQKKTTTELYMNISISILLLLMLLVSFWQFIPFMVLSIYSKRNEERIKLLDFHQNLTWPAKGIAETCSNNDEYRQKPVKYSTLFVKSKFNTRYNVTFLPKKRQSLFACPCSSTVI